MSKQNITIQHLSWTVILSFDNVNKICPKTKFHMTSHNVCLCNDHDINTKSMCHIILPNKLLESLLTLITVTSGIGLHMFVSILLYG